MADNPETTGVPSTEASQPSTSKFSMPGLGKLITAIGINNKETVEPNEKNDTASTDNGPKELNIVLIGETGTGKSTFINAFVNYLQDRNFTAAEMSNLVALIASKFDVYDKTGNVCHVTIAKPDDDDDDENEVLEVGKSATKEVRPYSFLINDGAVLVRLIDTPGMGDTGGIDQDNINCENILKYVAGLDYIHAICFLCRPQQTRATVYFEYCVAQIMSRLHADACKNIVFVFTGSRGSNYTPGDMYALLKQLAKNILKRPAKAKLGLDDNKFCLDNESFRYLAALKQGVQFSGEDRKSFRQSWNKSKAECWRLIDYIMKLPPHYVKNTAAINEARRVINKLSQPMADIAQLINDNIAALTKYRSDIDKLNANLNDLNNRPLIPKIELDVTVLDRPTTVCTSLNCVEVYQVGDKTAHHYKTRCHDPCYLENVEKEVIGSVKLLCCRAIGWNGNCKICGCTYHYHMHVYYLTKKIMTKVRDERLSDDIKNDEEAMKFKNKLIDKITDTINTHEEELEFIIQSIAKFAHFLQCNSISDFVDSFKEYINYIIEGEKSLGNAADFQKLDSLTAMLKEYEAQKKVFNQVVVTEDEKAAQTISPLDIDKTIQEIFNLQLNGRNIKTLYDSKTKALQKEWKFPEYKHPQTFGGPQRHEHKPRNQTNSMKKKLATPHPSYEKSQKKQLKPNDRLEEYYNSNKHAAPGYDALPSVSRDYPSQSKMYSRSPLELDTESTDISKGILVNAEVIQDIQNKILKYQEAILQNQENILEHQKSVLGQQGNILQNKEKCQETNSEILVLQNQEMLQQSIRCLEDCLKSQNSFLQNKNMFEQTTPNLETQLRNPQNMEMSQETSSNPETLLTHQENNTSDSKEMSQDKHCS